MRNFFYSVLLFAGCYGQIHAENISAKLTGTIIGTNIGHDYATNTASETVNTAKAVFDGDLQTFLAAEARSGGWAGLDLGGTHAITQICYCPYSVNPNRVVSGIFQGANSPDFSDATTLFTITQTPASNLMTPQAISPSKVFRYVRYLGPNDTRSNIAEVDFYGYKATGDSTTSMPQLTNLPTVYIKTMYGQDITSKDYYIKGVVNIVSESGTKNFTDSMEIKGRGNYSWTMPKKPYRIKLYNKTNLLGMPASAKNWTLINNYGDKTLMRNLLAFDFSKRLEMPYSPAGKPVDVVLNGEYKGCYQLCDQIEVNPGRVEVEKIKDTDTPQDILTGGYLIEMDAYAYTEALWFSSNRGIPVTIKYPDEDEASWDQLAYIQAHFNAMEDAIYANPVTGNSKYIDRATFLRHFLVGEFSGNTDTYWSTYMYKKRNDDKFYFGPVWDFDIAYENDNRTYPINDNPEWVYASKGSTANGVRSLVNQIFTDRSTLSELKKIWANYRDRGIITETALLKVVDDYATELAQSQKLNFERWDIMTTFVHQNPVIWGSYEGEVENVKNYIKNRILWMDNKLAYIPGRINENKAISSSIYQWTETNTLHVEGLSDEATIQIFDLTGRNIQTVQCSGNLTTYLNKGGYVLRISDKLEGKIVLKCLVP